jgi:hypothetical protein
MLTGECLLALQNRRRAPPAAETKDSERPPKSMTLAPFPLSFASCLAPPHRTESRRVLCCLLCCAELRSTHCSAPSAAAAAAVSAASAAAAAATDPSPLLSSSANVDNKHSASKAPVPDTALKTPNWRGRSQRRANTTIPNPTPAIGRWKTATKRTTISSPVSVRSRSSSRERTGRTRSQSPAQSVAARTNSKEERQKKCMVLVLFDGHDAQHSCMMWSVLLVVCR